VTAPEHRTWAERQLFLYGITTASDARAALGEARAVDPEVRSVEAGGLAALVGPGAGGDARARLLAHFDLLAAVAARVDVLPFRFGMLAGDERRAEEVLAARAPGVASTLERLRGSVEMRVRAQYRQDEVLRDIALARPEVQRLSRATRGSGGAVTAQRLQLGRLVVGALDRRRQEDAPRFAQPLVAMATDVRNAPSAVETEVMRASFLVDRARVDEFRRTAENSEPDGVHLLVTVTGPLPPWSFVGRSRGEETSRRRRG
jgi:hypothetical protein